MASIRSFKMGLSKSFHQLNTIGHDKMSHNEFHNEEDYDSDDSDENLRNIFQDRQNHNDLFTDMNTNQSQSGRNQGQVGSDHQWLDLNEEVVFKNVNYKSGKSNMYRLKKAMSKVSPVSRSSNNRLKRFLRDKEPSLGALNEDGQTKIFGKIRNGSRMSLSSPAEQDALLGLCNDPLDEVDLRQVKFSLSSSISFCEDDSFGNKHTVETRHGHIVISVMGETTKPVILTYHDLGLNHVTNFQAFMSYSRMRSILSSFCVVHVNAPGQDPQARNLPGSYVYPNMEELSETILDVKNHLGLHTFIGLGVGLGANVLSRFAIKYPNDVEALVLVNGTSTVAGWIEWGYQKLNIRQLKSGNMTTGSVDYLLWHHFGKTEECNHELVKTYRQHFEKVVNPTNLGLIVDAYIRRSDLGIVRELDPHKKRDVRMIRCPVLNITGNHSPHVDDTVTLNSRINPANSTWMKIQDCGLVIDEQPGKVTEAFRLFLQGQGYVVGNSRRSSCISVGSDGRTT